MFQLTGEQPVLLGRQAPTIKLSDAQTSRKHAEILLESNTWLIRDLDSTNGTWVNGQKITQITELEVGDRIVIGRHQFRVSQISDLPAPSPMPVAVPPPPAIDDEILGDAELDLSDSLSADILDDAPEVPDSALEDELGDILAEPELPELDSSSTGQPGHEAPDDVIDLDALLDDAPAEVKDESDASDELDSPAESESHRSAVDAVDDGESEAPGESGVIDLDALLSEEAEEPATDAPIHEPDPVITDSKPTPAEEEPTLELDEAPEPEAEPPAAPTVEDNASEALSEPESDSIDDIDAMLEELVDDEADAGEPDIIAEATPTPQDQPEDDELPDTAAQDVQDDNDHDEPADEDAATADEPDNLIDIDILAAAKPADEWSPSTPSAEDDQPSEPVDAAAPPADASEESGAPLDDSDLFNAEDTGLDLDQDVAALQDDADELPGEDQGLPDDSPADEPVEATDEEPPVEIPDDDEAPLDETEKKLLLTPDEQTQAVTSYKRSKLKVLVTLILLIAAIGVFGWYAFNFYSNRADANATPSNQTPAPQNTTDSSTPPDTTGISDASDTPLPADQPTDIPPTTEQLPVAPPPEDHTDAEAQAPDTHEQDSTTPKPILADEPAPQPAGPVDTANESDSSDSHKPIADAFADVTATVFDTPTTTAVPPTDPPADNPTNPAPDAPVIDEPADQTEEADPTVQPPVVDEITPSPTVDTGAAPTIAPEPSTEAAAHEHPDQSHLEIIAGVVDAQHKPGDTVSDQAAFAGARRIVYVVDASGSLVDSFPRVLNELSSTINQLNEEQAYTAIFFGADGVTELPKAGLKWANRDNKRAASDWLDPENGNVTAWGRGDLLVALQLAADYGADEIVLLSDNLIGRHASQEKIDTLLDDIANLTHERVQRIHAIQFFTRDPKQVLKSIADRFNGTHSLVAANPQSSAEHTGEDPFDLP